MTNLEVISFDDSCLDLVRQFLPGAGLVFLFLEVVTFKVSRVELTPEAVRTCRYYVYIVSRVPENLKLAGN